MKKKDNISSITENILKTKEKFESLAKFAGRASGLTSFLVNKSKEDILLKEATTKIPALKEKLIEKKEFYDRKTIKSDNIRILTKEINKCDEYVSKLGKETPLEDLKLILDWYYKTSEKYGF